MPNPISTAASRAREFSTNASSATLSSESSANRVEKNKKIEIPIKTKPALTLEILISPPPTYFGSRLEDFAKSYSETRNSQ
jgi:hypothetical protein